MSEKNITNLYIKIDHWISMASAIGLLKWIPDTTFLSLRYRLRLGKKLNLNNPRTFNEKLQWLKLYDRNPEYTKMVDKYEAKKYVANIIGEKYIIPTLGVWNSFDDIDFNKLPNQFVLKCTHDSGGVVICHDKSSFDYDKANKIITKHIRRNFFWNGREWPYKNVKPRIIAEEFLKDEGRVVPEDFKVYCINEKPIYIVCFHNRFNTKKALSETVYNTLWEPQPISLDNHFAVSNEIITKPPQFNELMSISQKLCKGFAQVRLDFYLINNRIYFGEITLYTASGFQPMIPQEFDNILGDKLDISFLQKAYK